MKAIKLAWVQKIFNKEEQAWKQYMQITMNEELLAFFPKKYAGHSGRNW